MSENFEAPEPMKSCGMFLLCRYLATAVLCAVPMEEKTSATSSLSTSRRVYSTVLGGE
jgi:hypothetical protein